MCIKSIKKTRSASAEAIRSLRGSRPMSRRITKVKKVVQLNKGHLENVLVPFFIVPTALGVAMESTALDQVNLEQVPMVWAQDTFESDSDHGYHDYEASGEEDEHEHPTQKRVKVVTEALMKQPGLFDYQPQDDLKVRGEKKESGYAYHTPDEEKNGFIASLLHAFGCKGCDLHSCKKMRLVLGHFLSCKRSSTCSICRQLLQIVAKHSTACDQLDCPVPMCSTLRANSNPIQQVSAI